MNNKIRTYIGLKLCLAIVLSMMDCHVEYAWVRPDIKERSHLTSAGEA